MPVSSGASNDDANPAQGSAGNAADVNSPILVVTGGSRGIGLAVAEAAARAGWRVAAGFHREPPALDPGDPATSRIHSFSLDVRNPDSQAAFFDRVDRELGRPSGLVTSAGVDRGPTPVDSIPHELVSDMFAINAVGLIESCSQFARRAALSHGGSGGVIVNVSSMAATIGGRRHKSVYAATKAAVDAFTIGAAKELAPEAIRVFAVRPGITRTEMTSALLSDPGSAAGVRSTIACGREALVDEIADPIVDLLSGRFAYASGSLINLAGGGFVI